MDTCLIWSFEHRQWWARDERGYTSDTALAGRYPLDRALAIVKHANVVRINEAVVLWDAQWSPIPAPPHHGPPLFSAE